MPPELLQLLAPTPPANLADLIALRATALAKLPPPLAPGEPALTEAWERWKNGLVQLIARFAVHPCWGRGCPKCTEYYALAQVLEARRRHLLAARRAKRVRWLWLPHPLDIGLTKLLPRIQVIWVKQGR